MKRSPKRAGYFLAPYALAPLWLLEQPRLAAVDPRQTITPPPVFIVGAPRTGSTILYQAITNRFDVAYISNLASLFVRSLWLGERLHRVVYRGAPHGCFRSAYGKTRGLNSPSECGKFWYRWFPRDRHFVTLADVDVAGMGRLRRTIAAITEDGGRPMVFKNLNCGQRLQVLHRVLPEALFLFIVRDPVQTARSILRGRVERQGSKERWTSVMPRNHAALMRLPYPAQIVGQVHALERQVARDLTLFPPRQSLQVHYEAFCEDPEATLERVAGWLGANGVRIGVRPGARLPDLRASAGSPRDEDEDGAQLRSEVAKLDWTEIRGEPAAGPTGR